LKSASKLHGAAGWEGPRAFGPGRGPTEKESYRRHPRGELWLLGMHIQPAFIDIHHTRPTPTRTRKLLLKAGRVCQKLIGKVEQKGYTRFVASTCITRMERIKLDMDSVEAKNQQ